MSIMAKLQLRIVLSDPPAGVMYCVQRRSRADCLDYQRSDGGDVVFNLTVEIRAGGDVPGFRGSFVQGPRGERYIAILIGTLAGDSESCWTRAAKAKLRDIPAALVEATRSRPGAVLSAEFPGTALSGGPSCATIRPIHGWTLISA